MWARCVLFGAVSVVFGVGDLTIAQPRAVPLVGNYSLGIEYRINCGGVAFIDTYGRAWSNDDHFKLPTTAQRDAETDVEYADTDYLDQADAHLLYSRRRFAPRSARSVAYELPVKRSGHYIVLLHFIEFNARAAEPGGRVFDVLIQGTSRNTVDLGAAVGLRRLLTQSYSTTVPESHGAVQLELFGVVRPPVVSAIELFGPSESIPDYDDDVSRTVSVAPVFEPPLEIETINALASLYHLSHVGTGSKHGDDVMFSTIGAPDYYVFRIDEVRNMTSLRDFEQRCAERCTYTGGCYGFFVRILTSAMYCAGIQQIDTYVSTNTLTRSWARDLGTPPDTNGSTVASTALSRRAIEAAAGNTSDYRIAFEGRTAENGGGPWLVFTTSLARSEYSFGPLDGSLRGCADHCTFVVDCVGFVLSGDPDNVNHMSCLGLRTLGLRRGAVTHLSSVSYVQVHNLEEPLGATASLPPTAPNTVHEIEVEIETYESQSGKASGSLGVTIASVFSVAIFVGMMVAVRARIVAARACLRRRVHAQAFQKPKDDAVSDCDWDPHFSAKTEVDSSSMSPIGNVLEDIYVASILHQSHPVMKHRLTSRLSRGQTTETATSSRKLRFSSRLSRGQTTRSTARPSTAAAGDHPESSRLFRAASTLQDVLYQRLTGRAVLEESAVSDWTSSVKGLEHQVYVAGGAISDHLTSHGHTGTVVEPRLEPSHNRPIFQFGDSSREDESSSDAPPKRRVLNLLRQVGNLSTRDSEREKEA